MPIPKKRLGNIQSSSGNLNGSLTPFQAYIQIASLEIIKSRLEKDRENSCRSITRAEALISEIEQKKSKLSTRINTLVSSTEPQSKAERHIRLREHQNTLKIRY